jgi:MoxR-like ATPase
MEGTYPLPEAQLDRFFFKLNVRFPDRDELHSILDRTTGTEEAEVTPVLTHQRIVELKGLVREVPVSKHVQDYAIRILQATHPDGPGAPDAVKRFVRFGSSPRGVQAILLASKIRALMEGRFSASADDVRASAVPALRHRMILNFEGEAEGVRTDAVLADVLKGVRDTAS